MARWKLYVWTDGKMILSVPGETEKEKAKKLADQIKLELPAWLSGETKILILGEVDVEIVKNG